MTATAQRNRTVVHVNEVSSLSSGHRQTRPLANPARNAPQPRVLDHPLLRSHAGADPPRAAQEVRDPRELEKLPGIEDREEGNAPKGRLHVGDVFGLGFDVESNEVIGHGGFSVS